MKDNKKKYMKEKIHSLLNAENVQAGNLVGFFEKNAIY